MKTILVIDSTAGGESAASRQLLNKALAELKSAHPASHVIRHDLGRNPIPHLTEANLAGVRGKQPSTPEELATRARSDALIAELRAADIVLIGAPMYNFSIPTTLRSWFDHVLRAGETFRYAKGGSEGLLPGKRVIVIETRGGLYSDGPMQSIDFQEPYLRQLLSFVGITDVSFVHAEKMGSGPDARRAALSGAERRLKQIVWTQPQAV